jgi:hypothetical protein
MAAAQIPAIGSLVFLKTKSPTITTPRTIKIVWLMISFYHAPPVEDAELI